MSSQDNLHNMYLFYSTTTLRYVLKMIQNPLNTSPIKLVLNHLDWTEFSVGELVGGI